MFCQANTTNSTLTVADNGVTPSTFVRDASQETAGKHAFVYRANGITLPSTGSYAVTLSNSGAAGTLQVCGVEYSGVATGAPTATNTGTATSTSVTTNSVTPVSAGALYFGGFSDASGLNPETITFGATGTEQFRNTNGSSFWPLAAADLIGSGANAFTWTLGDSVSWSACVAVYDAVFTATALLRRPRLGPNYRR